MNEQKYCDPERRQDFIFLFEVTDGNPNGDPDAGNLPRVDPETMQGLVTDVCIKRKVRNFVDATKGSEGRYKIYVQNKDALNTVHQRAYTELGLTSSGSKQKREDVEQARQWMCQNFFDIRSFGAVMTTGVNCGQVRGPLQLTFARSISPIVPLEVSITRIAVTKPEDFDYSAEDKKGGKVTEMGRKAIVPYGLYMGMGFYNPHFAKQTGFDGDDLQLFWDALQRMWDLDRSASRGMMACRGLYVFSHSSALGDLPAHVIKDKVHVSLQDSEAVPRQFSDYTVTVNADLPESVSLTRLVG
ncbi:MAG: type I-C CRISPR-associated protein Cas7/Csd2 [Candidatus Melainabacteria bacterium HGW-Melainabacteria-1]|nr:MAG: type I-C CRISPR-associated protein Cas7/Csd2 [Candidatus Melainabacteria bacterium HGW-Melainabacteria-1]